MRFKIHQQDTYSRGQLLIRSLFGWFYILIPHTILLAIFGLWMGILHFLSFWVILFTGTFPRSWFDYHVKMIRWDLRLQAVIFNLSDEYPPFGLDAEFPQIEFDVEYPENISRGDVLVRALFGIFYIALPHAFLLLFRMIATQILVFFSWWAVLFTGEFPRSWFDFIVGTLRWSTRLNCYLYLMTHEYPPFTGRELASENA